MTTNPSEHESTRIVITDANILINLFIANDLPLLSRIPGNSFVVCPEVLSELLKDGIRQAAQTALDDGDISAVSIDSIAELQTFAELRAIMGLGEAASLALAKHRGFLLASDEKKVFLREALSRLGEKRLITTPDIYVLAIRARVISVEYADNAKRVLERNRFRMGFGSFSELVSEEFGRA